MKTFLSTVLSLVVLVSAGVRAAEGNAEFTALEEKMSDALIKGDVAAFAKTVVDDWRIVLGDGKTLTLAQVKEALSSGTLKIRSVKLSELEVRIYGDTAVVIGLNQTDGSWDGEDFNTRDRFTDVFIKKDGAWKCVASHSSTMSD
jgi:ketosteroid isomerase-like protein